MLLVGDSPPGSRWQNRAEAFRNQTPLKNFDLSAQFQGVGGRTISIRNIINSGTQSNGYINQFSVDAWTADKGASSLYPRLTISDRGNNTQNSTFWLRSGDFLKLRTAEIGYNLPIVGL